MQPDPRVHLEDIRQAATEIVEFTDGMVSADWHGDARTQRAVERDFGIIGEALNRLNRTAPEIAHRIPQAGRIVSFRNLLAHEYHRVDPETVWNIANVHLPQLLRTVKELLAELASSGPGPEPDPDASPGTGL